MSTWDALQGQVFNDPDSGAAPGSTLNAQGQWVSPGLKQKDGKYFSSEAGWTPEWALQAFPGQAQDIKDALASGDIVQEDGKWYTSTNLQDTMSKKLGIGQAGGLGGFLNNGGGFWALAAGMGSVIGAGGLAGYGAEGSGALSGAGGVGELAGGAAGDTLEGSSLTSFNDFLPSQNYAQSYPGMSSAAGAAALPGVPQYVGAATGAVNAGTTLSRLLGGNGTGSDYANAAGLLAGPLASLGAGAYAAGAAKDAAQAGVDATGQSIAEQRRQYDLTRSDNAPFQQTGVAANARLKQLSGLDPAYTGSDSGYLTRPFTDADMQADPVYKSGLQFGLDEGTKGINARAIAGGGYDSGATLKALTRYGNDYGSTKGADSYNRFNANQTGIYNRLAGVSGAGQTAVNTVANAGTNATNAISQDLTGAGNARAAGIVGGSNAWGSAAQNINNFSNSYQSNQTLQALLQSNQELLKQRQQPTSLYG